MVIRKIFILLITKIENRLIALYACKIPSKIACCEHTNRILLALLLNPVYTKRWLQRQNANVQ